MKTVCSKSFLRAFFHVEMGRERISVTEGPWSEGVMPLYASAVEICMLSGMRIFIW